MAKQRQMDPKRRGINILCKKCGKRTHHFPCGKDEEDKHQYFICGECEYIRCICRWT